MREDRRVGMGWDWLPGRPLTCFGRGRPNLPLPQERVKSRAPRHSCSFGRGRPNPGSPGQALPLPSERVKSDAPPEELGTEGGNRLTADHSAHRCSGSRGKGYAARREGGQATAAMSERSRMGSMGGRRGRRIVRSARSRLRSRKAGEWDIAGWISYYTLYEYRRQACGQHSSGQL